jgi:hypothetical protein
MLAVGAAALSGIGVTQVVGATADTPSASPQPSANPFSSYTPPAGPELSVAQLLAIAMAEAQRDGAPEPSAVRVARGTLRAATEAVSPGASTPASPGGGQEAWLDSTVLLVTMQGNFVLNDAPVPAGDPAPKGSELALLIDTYTGEVEERALPVSPPSLQGLEAVSVGSGAASTAAVTGVVTGRLYVGGGGPPLLNGAKPLPSPPAPHYRVIVTEPNGPITKARVVAKTVTSRDGSFSIRIRPGYYRIAGQFKYGEICRAKNIAVRPGKTIRLRLECTTK